MTDLARLTSALAGHYAIEKELGAGGMATVYLAQDLNHHRQVAVKVLKPDLAATLGADRFFREIEVAAQLQHPHILPLLDSGQAGGFYFYVMPFVGGESLRERLAHHGELRSHRSRTGHRTAGRSPSRQATARAGRRSGRSPRRAAAPTCWCALTTPQNPPTSAILLQPTAGGFTSPSTTARATSSWRNCRD